MTERSAVDGAAGGRGTAWPGESCDLGVGSREVVCESFRPGTLEKWDIDPSRLPSRLVTARFSVFGQDGPKSLRPGLNGNALAFSGLMHVTGYSTVHRQDRASTSPAI